MGYLFTTKNNDIEEPDINKHDTIIATDEEVEIAKQFLLSEFNVDFLTMDEFFPEIVTDYVYKRTLVIFLRYVQKCMNTALHEGFLGLDYRPTASEEAVMVITTRITLPKMAEEYLIAYIPTQDYTISQLSDEDVLSLREEFERNDNPSEDELIAIGSTAYHVVDYERVITLTVTDRKGFLFFCEDSVGVRYIVPYHKLFRTEEEANRLVTERNERRNTAIEKYHLLDPTDDEKLRRNRSLALEWLHFNQNIPELLMKKLEKNIEIKAAV